MSSSLALLPKTNPKRLRATLGFEFGSKYLRYKNKQDKQDKRAKTKIAYIAPAAEVCLFPNILDEFSAKESLANENCAEDFEIKISVSDRIKGFIYNGSDAYKLYGIAESAMYTDFIDISTCDGQIVDDSDDLSTQTLFSLLRSKFKRLRRCVFKRKDIFDKRFYKFAVWLNQLRLDSSHVSD